MAKAQNPLFLSLYSFNVDRILEESSNVEEANERLRTLGRELAQQLYFSTDIEERSKETILTREDVAKLVEVVFRALFDTAPTEIDLESARGSIRVSDRDCIFCQDIHLEGVRGVGYCEVFSGILESILEFKGVDSKVFEELCKATGADFCVWNIRLI